jgi:hypothetical protein
MLILKRTMVAAALVLSLGVVSAQEAKVASTETATTASPATTAKTVVLPQSVTTQSSQETRQQFSQLLRESPSELGTILALDPTLLSNEGFLTGYPELARFVGEHPEVRRNPRFFLEQFEPHNRPGVLQDVMQGLMILSVLSLIAFVMTWLIRTIVDQKRWNHLSRTQSDVHNKILDRFSSSDELLAYVKSPAGAKFLESAPIPLHAEQATQNAPVARILWSIQLGVVVMAAALGLLVVSGRFDAESSRALFAMGVIALCVGGGFIVSAIVSLVLSRRLGLWPGTAAAAALPADDSGLMR